MTDFPEKLAEHERRAGLPAAEICRILHDVPYRTYMAWKHGEYAPPGYVQGLVIERLSQLPPKRGTHPMVRP